MKQSEKRQNFEKLVDKRMTNALQQIRLVGNLSNRTAYEYSDKDVRKIVGALDAAVAELKQRFKKKGGTGRYEFRIGED